MREFSTCQKLHRLKRAKKPISNNPAPLLPQSVFVVNCRLTADNSSDGGSGLLMRAPKLTNSVVALAFTDGVRSAVYFANQSGHFGVGKYRTDSLEAAGFPPDARNSQWRMVCRSSMLIGKQGRGGSFDGAPRNLYEKCTGREISGLHGHFVQIADFCTNFVISFGIVDFLAFCKFLKL
jgi:hypothetical protein